MLIFLHIIIITTTKMLVLLTWGLVLESCSHKLITIPKTPMMTTAILVGWNQLHSFESQDIGVIYPRKTDDDVVNEINMFQMREQRSDFVKVNMDGVLIGRKISILDHSSYLSLAAQLEDMFGKQSLCGYRLFESGSEFSVWYKDRDEQWRIAGHVPWKEIIDGVKRIRIILKDETLFRPMTTLV